MRIRSCDDCGKVLPDDALFCGQCGKGQPQAPPATARPANASHLASTMIATNSADPLEATAAKGAPSPDLLQKAKPSEPREPVAKQIDPSKTMIDVAPSFAAPLSAPPETPPLPTPIVATKPSAPAIPAAAPNEARGRMNRTVVGYAAPPPVEAPPLAPPPPAAVDPQMHELASTLASSANAAAPAPVAQLASLPSMSKTIVGSAPPPPLAPNASSTLQSKAPAAALPPSAQFAEDGEPPSSEAPRSQRISSAIVLVCAALFIMSVAALVLYFRARRPAITAKAAVDELGIEVLRVRCPGCADGAVVSIGSSSAKVTSESAQLRLAEPLQLGPNRFSVSVTSREGKTESMSIPIVLAYRIRPDFTSSRQVPPVLTLRVEALPDTAVSILGAPVTLDANGHGSATVDLSKDTRGQTASLALVERKIDYVVKAVGEPGEKGVITARAKVPPLTLFTPLEGQLVATESFVLAGQTLPGATLTIDGHPATVDPKGFFGVNVKASALGDRALEIVTSDDGFAARSTRVTVVRIPDANESAKALEASALSYRAYPAGADTAGKTVVVDGTVVETRTEAHHTVMVISDKRDCAKRATCLARVTAGTEEVWKLGEHAKAFGRVVGTSVREGVPIPDVQAVLMVHQK